MALVELRHGAGEVVLAPHVGGGILSWTDHGTPMLRPALPGALELGLVRSLGAYPLIPFSNRIRHGVFSFAGTRHELAAIFTGHMMHGVGWKRPWTISSRGAAEATIMLDHAPDEFWPFAFHGEQHFTLSEGTLTWAMRVTNLHDGPAPAGLGFHPYFPRGQGVRLRFAADGVWLNGPDNIPMRHTKIPGEWDHEAGRRVGSTIIDNCFTGWRAPAMLEYDTHVVSVTADPLFRFLIAFTPEDKNFFAVEPVSHMNDGVNRMAGEVDHGIRVLEPGETLAGEMRMTVIGA